MKKSLTYTKKHSEKRQIRRAILAGSIQTVVIPETPEPKEHLVKSISAQMAFKLRGIFHEMRTKWYAVVEWLREYALEVAIGLMILSLIAFVATIVTLNLIY